MDVKYDDFDEAHSNLYRARRQKQNYISAKGNK